MNTPWGQSDYSIKFVRGVNFYGTPSHGGVKVSDGMNKLIPDAFRKSDGWYEEDCDMNIPFAFLPALNDELIAQHFKSLTKFKALQYLKTCGYYDKEWSQHYGK